MNIGNGWDSKIVQIIKKQLSKICDIKLPDKNSDIIKDIKRSNSRKFAFCSLGDMY